MFPNRGAYNRVFCLRTLVLLVLTCAIIFAQTSVAQSAPAQSPSSPQQQVPGAGGPQGDVSPIAVPKKKDEPPPERPKPPKTPENMPQYSHSVNVPLVQVPVMVLTNKGQFVPGLKKDNFKVYEDGIAQNISNFALQEAPITAVLLVEFANTNYTFMYDALNASYAFAESLKPQDWIAVISYDMQPHILLDFTQDKRAIMGTLNQLRIPGFRERNVFDALFDTIDRIESIEGRKYIVLVGSGLDTFSKITYDQILKKIKGTKDITIFAISTGFAYRNWLSSHPAFEAQLASLDYTQAENQMRTFAKMTGGKSYFPRFQAEFREIFQDVSQSIRNQYVLAYHPSNPKLDGTYRKLKIDLVAPDGQPLKVHDEKGKDVKVQIVAREGYTAKHSVE